MSGRILKEKTLRGAIHESRRLESPNNRCRSLAQMDTVLQLHEARRDVAYDVFRGMS